MGKIILWVTFLLASVKAGPVVDNDITEFFSNGVDVTKKTIVEISSNSQNVNNFIHDTEETIQEMIELINDVMPSLNQDGPNKASKLIGEFLDVKHDLVMTRQTLRTLAQETVITTEDVEFVLSEFEESPDFALMEIKLDLMKGLVKKTNTTLSNAIPEYNHAARIMDKIKAEMETNVHTLNKLIENGGNVAFEHASTPWLIVLDILGCLGFCSLISDTVNFNNKKAEVQTIAKKLLNNVSSTKEKLDDGISFLTAEVELVRDWNTKSNDAGNSIRIWYRESNIKNKIFRKRVVTKLTEKFTALRESAQKYLKHDQPIVNGFSDIVCRVFDCSKHMTKTN